MTRSTRDKPIFSRQDHAVVRRAMHELPIRDRLIVELRFWNNLSVEEIAEFMCMRRADVESRLNAVFAMLRDRCENDPEFSRFFPCSRTA